MLLSYIYFILLNVFSNFLKSTCKYISQSKNAWKYYYLVFYDVNFIYFMFLGHGNRIILQLYFFFNRLEIFLNLKEIFLLKKNNWQQ